MDRKAFDFRKQNYANLCSLCDNPTLCSNDDRFSGYEGTLRCISQGRGDVAWTKLPTVKSFFGVRRKTTSLFTDTPTTTCFYLHNTLVFQSFQRCPFFKLSTQHTFGQSITLELDKSLTLVVQNF